MTTLAALAAPAPALEAEPLRPPGGEPCVLLHGALSPAECRALIAAAEAAGYAPTGAAYPPDYRDNDRLVLDDPALAAALLARLGAHLPARLARGGATWRLVGLNPRLRGCRYRDGQRFARHRDGPHTRGPAERSLLTVMLYLNDAAAFAGGATRFYADAAPETAPWAIVRPRAGTAIVFDHALWHDGEAVPRGTKYVLRSDVIYRREGRAGDEAAGHAGYVWRVVTLGDGRLASAGRDGAVRLWTPGAAGLTPAGAFAAHSGSVTALVEGPAGALWTGARDGAVRAFAPDGAGALRPAAEACPAPGVAVLALAAAGDRVAAAGADGALTLLEPSGRVAARAPAAHAGWAWALAVTPDGALVSGGDDGALRRWDAATLAPLGAPAPAGAPVRALAVEADGALAWGDAEGGLHRRGARRAAHAGAVRALLPLPGGRLASAGEDARVRVWGGEGALLAELAHADFVTCLTRTRAGRLVSGSYDGTLRAWAV